MMILVYSRCWNFTAEHLLNIIVGEDVPREKHFKRVPQGVRYHAAFVMDTTSLEADIVSYGDDNSSWTGHSKPRRTYHIEWHGYVDNTTNHGGKQPQCHEFYAVLGLLNQGAFVKDFAFQRSASKSRTQPRSFQATDFQLTQLCRMSASHLTSFQHKMFVNKQTIGETSSHHWAIGCPYEKIISRLLLFGKSSQDPLQKIWSLNSVRNGRWNLLG